MTGPTVAVDVVLLPPDEVRDIVIGLSEQLRSTSPLVLNTRDRLPHTSLFMGYIPLGALPDVKTILANVAAATPLLRVSSTKLGGAFDQAEQMNVWGLDITQSPPLRSLHETLVDRLGSLRTRGHPARSYILSDNEQSVRDRTHDYTTSFVPKTSGDRFWPHMTLGFGELDESAIDFPIEFDIDRLAMCQMGNYNTCRKILAEWQLGDAVS